MTLQALEHRVERALASAADASADAAERARTVGRQEAALSRLALLLAERGGSGGAAARAPDGCVVDAPPAP